MPTIKGPGGTAGISHKAVEAWCRTAPPGAELRAGRGLYLRQTTDGAAWLYRFASPVTGRQTRVHLWDGDDCGRLNFPAASLVEAERRAGARRAMVKEGRDPVLLAQEAARATAQAAELERQRQEAESRRLTAEAEAAQLAQERRITVRALFNRWQAVELKPHIGTDGRRVGRKDGGRYTAEQFGRYVFPALGERAAADVGKADLMAILDAVKAAGKLRTANVLLASLKQMFRFALAREIIDRNPLDTVTKRDVGGRETQRDRVLKPDEIAALHKALPAAGLNVRTAAAVRLLLATGARVGELMGAAWADEGLDLAALAALPEAADVKVGVVDLTAATWHMPTTKNEREHTIHLSAFALEQFRVLASLREAVTDERGVRRAVPWVFPNTGARVFKKVRTIARTKANPQPGPVCVKSFGKQLADRQREPEQRIQGRSKNTSGLRLAGGRWTAHDLRRTAGTLMASLGVSGDVIDERLNHVIESRVRKTYIRDRRPTEQARAFDALGDRLTEITTGQAAASNVVALRAA